MITILLGIFIALGAAYPAAALFDAIELRVLRFASARRARYATQYLVGNLYWRSDTVLTRENPHAWMRSGTPQRSPRSRAPLLLVGFAIGLAGVLLFEALADASPCGEERASVKLGLDADAQAVNTRPVDTTIADLIAIKRPAHIRADRRADTTERTVWRVSVTITAAKLESDGDFHVVVSDARGNHMIVEIPAVRCASGGAWARQIAAAREAAEAALHPGKKLRRMAVPAVITGVGFFDFVHGQVGVAASGIELHPVLAIEVGGGS